MALVTVKAGDVVALEPLGGEAQWKLAYVTKEANNVVQEVRPCGSARPSTPQDCNSAVWAINADMQEGALALAGKLTAKANSWPDAESLRKAIAVEADKLKGAAS